MEYLLNGMSSWIQQNKIILLFSLLVIFLVRIFQIHFHNENNFWIFLEYLLNTHSISFLSLFYFLFQKHHHHIFCFLLFLSWKAFFRIFYKNLEILMSLVFSCHFKNPHFHYKEKFPVSFFLINFGRIEIFWR